jgi:glutamyl-tRNA reductase
MSVLVAGISHRTSPVELRERFAFGEAELAETLSTLRNRGLCEESVLLSTCNRVELYGVESRPPEEALAAFRQFLLDHAQVEAPLTEEIYTLAEPQSIEHLFRVVSGLDSMVLGETEILGQVKKAYETALKNGHTGSRLNKVFQRAFNVAKHIRTETMIQRGSVSVASVAVDLAEKIFDSLKRRTVMVLGAGDTSEKAAKALLSRGARNLLVANRTFERAENLAAELGGQAIPFEDWPDKAIEVDIIVSSTAAQDYVIDHAHLKPLMKRRRHRTLLLIDIAVPRDIDPAVNFLESVFVYNIDDLQAIADDSMQQRREEIARCEELVRNRAISLLSDPRRHAWTPSARRQGDSRVLLERPE